MPMMSTSELRPRVVVVDDDVLVGDEVNVERELPEEGVLLNRAGGGDAARAQGGEQTANDRERFTIRTLQHRHRSGELSRRRRGAGRRHRVELQHRTHFAAQADWKLERHVADAGGQMRVQSRIRLIRHRAAAGKRPAVDRSIQLAQRHVGARQRGARGQPVDDDAWISEADFSGVERDVAVDAGSVDRAGDRELRRQTAGGGEAGAAHERRQHPHVDVAVGDDGGLTIRETHLSEDAERGAGARPVPRLDAREAVLEHEARRHALRHRKAAHLQVEAREGEITRRALQIGRRALDVHRDVDRPGEILERRGIENASQDRGRDAGCGGVQRGEHRCRRRRRRADEGQRNRTGGVERGALICRVPFAQFDGVVFEMRLHAKVRHGRQILDGNRSRSRVDIRDDHGLVERAGDTRARRERTRSFRNGQFPETERLDSSSGFPDVAVRGERQTSRAFHERQLTGC